MEIQEIIAYLEGTCNSIDAVIDRFELSIEACDLEDTLLEANLECCPGCGWWMESCELVDEENEVVGCRQCRYNIC